MKKFMFIGLGCLAFAVLGSFSKAEAGVQVSINLGNGHPYYRPAPLYCGPQPVVVYRPRPAYYPYPYYAAPVYYRRYPYPYVYPYACR